MKNRIFSLNYVNSITVMTELQIREGIEDNLKIIFSYLSTKTYWTLELSRQDGSNDGLQHMF